MESTTITSHLMGGLGNQMFQIAFAYCMSRRTGATPRFVRNQAGYLGAGSHPSKYYETLYQKLTFVDSLPIVSMHERHQNTAYDVVGHLRWMVDHHPGMAISFEGYWQAYSYYREFKNEIRELFTPAGGMKQYLGDVFVRFPELREDNDFCFIGVRRGDYIRLADGANPCGMDFYTKAMRLANKSRYYILTDDVAWCKEKFVGDEFRFLEIADDLTQFMVSTLFHTYIISNSTFYWWGSFMSMDPDAVTIAPSRWGGGPNVLLETSYPIYRDNMSILDRAIEV